MRAEFHGATYRGTTYVHCRLCKSPIVESYIWRIGSIPLCREHYDVWERKLDAAAAKVAEEFAAAIGAARKGEGE